MTLASPAWTKDLVIYKVATKAFTSPAGPESGNFKSLTQRLPYLAELFGLGRDQSVLPNNRLHSDGGALPSPGDSAGLEGCSQVLKVVLASPRRR